MHPIVRRVIILGTPLALGILELFHPILSKGIYNGISNQLGWWITLHFLQLPLFCLLAFAVYLLLDSVQGTLATLSKVALAIFVIFYPALDAILGLGSSAMVSYGNAMGGIPQAVIGSSLDNFFFNPVTLLVGTLGELGWALGLLLAVLALSRPTQPRWLVTVTAVLIALALSYYQVERNLNVTSLPISMDNLSRLMLLLAIALGLLVRPRLPAGLMVMAAYFLSADHAPPTGPAAMACFFVAALQLEFFPEKNRPSTQQNAPTVKQNVTPSKQDAPTTEQNMTLSEQEASTAEQNVTPSEQDAPTAENVVPDPS